MKAENVVKGIEEVISGLEAIKKEFEDFNVTVGIDLAKNADMEDVTLKSSKETSKKSSTKSKKSEKAEVKAEVETDSEDYASMKYNDLKKLAVERGLKTPNVSKADIIAFLTGEKEDDAEEAESVEAEDIENDTDEEDLTEKVNELLNGVDTEDIADFLSENGISAKGKRPTLIAKIVSAIEDGDLSLEDLEVEDEEEPAPEKEEKKPSKKSAKKAKEVEPEEDSDEDEPLGEYTKNKKGKYVREDDNELLATLTKDRYNAMVEYMDGIKSDLNNKKKRAKLVDEVEEFFGDDYEKEDYEDSLEEFLINKFLLMTDDDGETHDFEDPYEINEVPCCCGEVLTETDDGFICSVCESEYEGE